MILENVPTILTQLSTIKGEVEPLGYVVHVLNLCPTDIGLPQRRPRSYILVGLSSVISQANLSAAADIYGLMCTPEMASLDEHLLPEDHPLVAVELQRRLAPPHLCCNLCPTTCK